LALVKQGEKEGRRKKRVWEESGHVGSKGVERRKYQELMTGVKGSGTTVRERSKFRNFGKREGKEVTLS